MLRKLGAWGFSLLLEENPHGSVHGGIGKDMGFIQTSARDPIFWLHHANIDRLWNAWLNGSNLELPPATWNKTFRFDTAGQWTMEANATLNSRALPNAYGYSDENKPAPSAASFVPSATLTGGTRSRLASEPLRQLDVSSIASISVGAEPLELALPLSSLQSNRLSALAADTAPSATNDLSSAWLVLENVAVTDLGRNGGFDVGVLLLGGDEPILLTSINTFALSAAAMSHGGGDHGAHHGSAPAEANLVIPLTDALRGAFDRRALGGRVRVGLAPSVADGASGPLITIGSASVRVSSLPVE